MRSVFPTIGRRGVRFIIAGAISMAGLSGGAIPANASTPGNLAGETAQVPAANAIAECPSGDFLANLKANPANATFPAPSLSVSCTDAHMVVRSNGIPTFPFVGKTPNALRAQDFVFRISRVPVELSTPGSLNLGTIGVAVDGLPIYGPFEAPTHGTADPAADGILDACGGHTGPAGEYHVHATPSCLPEGRMATPGAVVGYALDGYPIMSPVVCHDDACTTTHTVRSGWVQVSTDRNVWSRYTWREGAGDLDRCNGMTGPDGRYRYYAVSTFPYFLGCYHGDPTTTGRGLDSMNPNTSAIQGGASVGSGQRPESDRPASAPPPGPRGSEMVPPSGRPMVPRPRR